MGKLSDEELFDVKLKWNSIGAYTAILKLSAHIDAQADDIEGYEKIISQSGDIMSKTADALKGPAPENTLHSTHDLAEVAAKVVEENKRLRDGYSLIMGLEPDCLGGDNIAVSLCSYLEGVINVTDPDDVDENGWNSDVTDAYNQIDASIKALQESK